MARRSNATTDVLGMGLVLGAAYFGYRALLGQANAAGTSPSGGSSTSTSNTAPSPNVTGNNPAPGAPANAPRGIRNNNPGNILYSPANNWQGQIGNDGSYAKFSSPTYGIRAAFVLLKNYQANYGINTILKLAQRWAPAPLNNPTSYANNVLAYSGLASISVNGMTINANTPLNFSNPNFMIPIMRGIIVAENGAAYKNYYPENILQAAWNAS
jgi:hypothetical protein